LLTRGKHAENIGVVLLAIATFLHPRLSDSAMQERYESKRKQRLLPLLRWLSAGYLLLTLLWIMVPTDRFESELWYFVSIQSIISAVSATLTVVLLRRWPRLWRHYDFLCCLWACHCITCRLLSVHYLQSLFLESRETHAGPDDGHMLLVSAGCIAGFAACVQANALALLVVTHWSVAVNVSLKIYFAANEDRSSSTKLLTAYYLTCMVVIELGRRLEQQRQQIFILHSTHELHMHTCMDDSAARSMPMSKLKETDSIVSERPTTVGSQSANKISADAKVASADIGDELESATKGTP